MKTVERNETKKDSRSWLEEIEDIEKRKIKTRGYLVVYVVVGEWMSELKRIVLERWNK